MESILAPKCAVSPIYVEQLRLALEHNIRETIKSILKKTLSQPEYDRFYLQKEDIPSLFRKIVDVTLTGRMMKMGQRSLKLIADGSTKSRCLVYTLLLVRQG